MKTRNSPSGGQEIVEEQREKKAESWAAWPPDRDRRQILAPEPCHVPVPFGEAWPGSLRRVDVASGLDTEAVEGANPCRASIPVRWAPPVWWLLGAGCPQIHTFSGQACQAGQEGVAASSEERHRPRKHLKMGFHAGPVTFPSSMGPRYKPSGPIQYPHTTDELHGLFCSPIGAIHLHCAAAAATC